MSGHSQSSPATVARPLLAVVAPAARLLAQAAVQEGLDVYALDLFGDADTRALAQGWWCVGDAQQLRIDPLACTAGLQAAAAFARASGRELLGWVPGGGLEGEPQLLAAGAAQLPLLGCTPQAMAQVRDPACFFEALDEAGIAHPPVALQRPADGQAWLLKDLRGCGGSHVRLLSAAAAVPPLAPGQVLQRRAPGLPMSVSFVAGLPQGLRLLGFNRQVVRTHAADAAVPYQFCGVVGPVPLPAAVQQGLLRACEQLARRFALRGLCSLDFLLNGDQWSVLELNPRPPASTALYAAQQPMRLHLEACLGRPLGGAPVQASPPAGKAPVQGWYIVYARREGQLSSEQARWLAAQPDVHDLPRAGQRLQPGQPLCSLSACGHCASEVLQSLGTRREALLGVLESTPESTALASPP